MEEKSYKDLNGFALGIGNFQQAPNIPPQEPSQMAQELSFQPLSDFVSRSTFESVLAETLSQGISQQLSKPSMGQGDRLSAISKEQGVSDVPIEQQKIIIKSELEGRLASYLAAQLALDLSSNADSQAVIACLKGYGVLGDASPSVIVNGNLDQAPLLEDNSPSSQYFDRSKVVTPDHLLNQQKASLLYLRKVCDDSQNLRGELVNILTAQLVRTKETFLKNENFSQFLTKQMFVGNNSVLMKKTPDAPRSGERFVLKNDFIVSGRIFNKQLSALNVGSDNLLDERIPVSGSDFKAYETHLRDIVISRITSEVVKERLEQSLLSLFPGTGFREEGIDPGKTAAETYAWRKQRYPLMNRDTTRLVKLDGKVCRFVDVEFGGTNLTPPDRIKQAQKAAVGALVIEPKGAGWKEFFDDTAIDRQNPGPSQANVRATRATAVVSYPVTESNGTQNMRSFRDFVLVHQKGLNLRYKKDGSAVPTIAAEKEKAHEAPDRTAPEDAHDSGHMAINYGTEPMWYRFGVPPDAPFGKEGFGRKDNAWQAFSNRCCDSGSPQEPYIPIFKVSAGQEMRLRALLPNGSGRATTGELHGHNWPRDPYLAENVDGQSFPVGNKSADWGTPSQCIGENPMSMGMGGQESIAPMAHFDLVYPRAGGKFMINGDYLWRDHAGFGITSGLWSIIRVEKSDFKPKPLRTSCKLAP